MSELAKLGRPPFQRRVYKCLRCGIERIGTDNPREAKRRGDYCQPCSIAIYNESRPPSTVDKKKVQAEYYQRNKQRLDQFAANWRQRERLSLIAQFGGCCIQCGEADAIVLDFDHIHNDGHKERGKNIIYTVKKTPDRFQLLCKNCNWKKEYWRRKNAISE